MKPTPLFIEASATLLLIAALTGCGGSGGGNSGGSEPPAPVPHQSEGEGDGTTAPTTPKGTELDAAVSTVIGSEGGSLQSADGSVTLQVPAGALSADTTISMQPISNQAIGGIGTAFRILPEGLRSNLPMTLQFHPTASNLAGTALRFVSIAYQDEAGHWRAFETPEHDMDSNTVAIQTRHFSDWSMVAGVQLWPASATVKTGASQALEVRICDTATQADQTTDSDAQPALYACASAPVTALSAKHWSVNGAEGGSATSGTITPNTDKSTGEATFTAPDSVPDVNPVAASVEVYDFDNPADKTILVSNLKIVPDITCEALKKVEFIEAGVNFALFEWTARNENQSYEGHQSGRLGGTMTNQIVPAARDLSPIGIWTSQNSVHTGLVTMFDTRQLFYPDKTVTQQAVGNGLPYNGMDVPSYITMTVDYATCEYELVASFVVLGTVTEEGVSVESPIAPGGFYYRESVPDFLLQQGKVERTETLSARYDPNDKINGYYPAGQSSELRAEGHTEADWELTLFQ